MAQQASITTPTQGPLPETTMFCYLSVAREFTLAHFLYPSNQPVPFQTTTRTRLGRKHAPYRRRREKLIASPALYTVQTVRLLIRLRSVTKIRLHGLEALGEQRLGFGVVYSWSDDAILPVLPVGRRRDLEL